MPIKLKPQTFREAFERALLNRAGITITTSPLFQEEMNRDLERALRLNGFSGDRPDSTGESSAAGEDGLPWSDDAQELMHMVAKLGVNNQNLSSEAFLKPFFRNLRLMKLAISELDADCVKFTRLTYLDVSQNALTAIDNLPPNLRFLKAYSTNISKIACKPTTSLCFLGLGHSYMGAAGLEQAARRFRNLLSLDLSFTEVAGIQEVVTHLQPLQKLRQLCLSGSPVCLLPYHRLKLLHWLPQLKVLDGVDVSDEEMADAALVGSSPSAALAPWPSTIRVGVRLRELHGARALFDSFVTPKQLASLSLKQQETREGEEEEKAVEADQGEPIAEFCAGGALRICFELPDGTWVETQDVPVDGPASGTSEGSDLLYDEFDFASVRCKTGEPLVFEIQVGNDEGLCLCRWIRRGLHMKICFIPAKPAPVVAEGELAEAASLTSRQASPDQNSSCAEGAGGLSRPGSVLMSGDSPEPEDVVPIGGVVIVMDDFLYRTDTSITEEIRQAREVPSDPAPWQYEAANLRVVPFDRWLEPEIQAPGPLGTTISHISCASMHVDVVLHAPEPSAADEEEPPPSPIPEPKAKGKKK